MNDFLEITATTGLSVTPAGCDLDARTTLNQLAGEINALAKDAEDSACEAIYKAAECGGKLLQAKDLVRHGKWTAWLKANTHVSVRTSERWMTLAKAKAGDLPSKVNYTVAKRLLEEIDLEKYDTPDEAINDTVSFITPAEVVPSLPPTTGGSTPTTLGSTPSNLPGTAITVCGSTSADEILVRPMTDQEITKRAIAIKKARRAERDAARAQRQAEALAVNHPLSGEAYKLVQAYARDIDPHVEDGSVDAIITDPPYSIEYIDCYRALAELAPRELKPGGHLLVMVGQLYLPEIIAALNQPPLVYRWTLNYRMGGPPASIVKAKVWTNWKPILWFTNGPSDWDYVNDDVNSSGTAPTRVAAECRWLRPPGREVHRPRCAGARPVLRKRHDRSGLPSDWQVVHRIGS